MSWQKLGNIFAVDKSQPWAQSHAMLPTPLLLGDKIRVYYTTRDGAGMSRISFIDVSADDPTRVLYRHDRPLFEPGAIGLFDDSGTLGTCAQLVGNDVYLYYNGYNRRVVVPWSNAVGLAISRDGGTTFEKAYPGPILDRTPTEPYFVITPCILREGGTWHMWYTSGTGWVVVKDRPEPLYVIKYARSADGIRWERDNVTCIPPLDPTEANARAAVVKENGLYKMWFCFRGSLDFRGGKDSYRLGYAESKDPIHWSRDDSRVGIATTEGSWDSVMQAYPAVVTVGAKRYLFYNGDGFGATGIGCAVWVT